MGPTAFLPKQVLLIRHAEKTGRPTDSGLSRRGRARAAELAEVLPAQFGTPDAIIACANEPGSTRPFDTVRPLADRLGLVIEDRWGTPNFEALARTLATSQAFADQRVLVCWRKETLPDLARSLGAGEVRWPRTDFESIWVFEPGPAGVIFHAERQQVELRQPYVFDRRF